MNDFTEKSKSTLGAIGGTVSDLSNVFINLDFTFYISKYTKDSRLFLLKRMKMEKIRTLKKLKIKKMDKTCSTGMNLMKRKRKMIECEVYFNMLV